MNFCIVCQDSINSYAPVAQSSSLMHLGDLTSWYVRNVSWCKFWQRGLNVMMSAQSCLCWKQNSMSVYFVSSWALKMQQCIQKFVMGFSNCYQATTISGQKRLKMDFYFWIKYCQALSCTDTFHRHFTVTFSIHLFFLSTFHSE